MNCALSWLVSHVWPRVEHLNVSSTWLSIRCGPQRMILCEKSEMISVIRCLLNLAGSSHVLPREITIIIVKGRASLFVPYMGLFKHIYLSSIAKQVFTTYINHVRVRFMKPTSTGVIWRNMIVTRVGLEPVVSVLIIQVNIWGLFSL
jgi:hypothetical protein